MTTVVQWLSSLGIGAVIATIIGGLITRRKLSAEATKIITDAAAGVVTTMRADRDEDREEIRALKAENRAQATELREQGRVLEVHSTWDRQAYDALQLQGINLPAPPPLYVAPNPTPAGS